MSNNWVQNLIDSYYKHVNRKEIMTTEEQVEIKELYEILIKTTRRCVRDMKHMLDDLKENSLIKREEWQERLNYYEFILNETGNYRISLHMKINELEFQLQREINKNKELVKVEENTTQTEIPF